MDKGPPTDDLTEESEKRVKEDDIEKQNVKIEVEGKKQDIPSAIKRIHEESRTLAREEDSGRQYAEDNLKGTRDKTDFKVGKFDNSLNGESKSEELSKTGMFPTKSFNRIETLKEEKNSQMQNELKQIESSNNLKPKLLPFEKRVQEDDIEKQVKIEVEGKEQDTTSVVKGIHEESRVPNTEKDSERRYEEDKLEGTRDKAESKVVKLDYLDEEGSKREEPSKMGMHLIKSLNGVEALKEEEKSQIRDDPKQVNSSNGLKQTKGSDTLKEKLLALERELSLESIESKPTEIFVPSELKKKSSVGTEKEISGLDIKPQRKGISHMMAVIFIIAAATGGAFRSLPYHLRESTWFGIFLFLLLGLNSLYACLCVGWCWSLMEETWPEYLAWSRVPYQDIAYRAIGPWMKYVVAFLIDITTLLLCGNYIISISENIGRFVNPHITICYFMIIVSVILSFSSVLGSYRNIKFIGATDVILSLLFILFVVICLFYDQSRHGSRDYSKTPHESIIMAFAGMSYAFGTGIIMPNIVVEMENRSKFTESCVTAYMVILAMYTVLAVLGYAAYGSKTPSLITNYFLESESLRTFGILIDATQALQLLTTFAVYFIPLALALEEVFKCPDRFCPRRVIIRLGTMIVIILVILGVPRLITHMDIIAATALNVLSFIFPPIFHVFLLRKEKGTSSRRTQSMKELFLVVEILFLGTVIALVVVYLSVKNTIEYSPKYLSCYLNMSLFPLR